jgi:hypothetical protein
MVSCTPRAQAVDEGKGGAIAVHDGFFGDLQVAVFGRQAGRRQCFVDIAEQIGVGELDIGQVDGHHHR